MCVTNHSHVPCCYRDFSRQEYLKKREEKKIEELEADLQDAEMLFAGEKLSRKEQEDIEYKRTVLELAKKRKQAQEDLNKDDGYHMPTAYDKEGAAPSERYKVLTERYRLGSCYSEDSTRTEPSIIKRPHARPLHFPACCIAGDYSGSLMASPAANS